MDLRTRKPMMVHKGLHDRDDVDIPYVSRKEGGRGLDSIQDNVNALIQRLEDYIKKRRGRLITVTKNNTDKHQQNKNNQKTKIGKQL